MIGAAFIFGGGNMERAVFRFIEHELFSYERTKREIQELREDIISDSSAPRDSIPSAGHISDTTARKAIRLMTNTALTRMTRTVAAIDRAMCRLNENHRALFELRYKQALPWHEVCAIIPVSERTYFRMRQELVMAVGREMGLEN